MWEPTHQVPYFHFSPLFQSTAPVWEPTGRTHAQQRYQVISIHGSRVGTDDAEYDRCMNCVISIHGSRVGTDIQSTLKRNRLIISIHGSRVGTDIGQTGLSDLHIISIHGSRVGTDFCKIYQMLFLVYFNPRLPCGNRPKENNKMNKMNKFQSTAPVWEPTLAMRADDDGFLFQSTAPVWEPTKNI